jgi:hypothetical protein
LNQSLEEYVNRYGLKKTMYILENSWWVESLKDHKTSVWTVGILGIVLR